MKVAKEYNVELSGLKIQMRPALIITDNIYKLYGQELTITCTNGGVHSAGSLHYYGYAFDIRTRDLTERQRPGVYEQLKRQLPNDFDVVLHKTHIHIEYDAAKNIT